MGYSKFEINGPFEPEDEKIYEQRIRQWNEWNYVEYNMKNSNL